MENNNTNKAKLMALYYGQNVFSYPNKKLPYDENSGGLIEMCSGTYFDEAFLSLRSISSLTDVEAKGIGFEDAESLNRCYNSYGHDSFFSYFIRQKEIDILRSLSILIPWMDLSVENILNYGWAVVDKEVAKYDPSDDLPGGHPAI